MRAPGTGLKLIMAVSGDGFLARGREDDMRWTGFTDKQVFRLLTSSHPILLAGSATARQLPPLPHRRLVTLSRRSSQGMTLDRAVLEFPGAWLIGGPTVAEAALRDGLVESAYLCCTTAPLGGGIPADVLKPYLPAQPKHTIVMDLSCIVKVFHGP